MNSSSDRVVRKILAGALVVFPGVFILVFLLHFRHFADFFNFHQPYTPPSPDRVVAALIRGHNRWPLLHDPHIIAYLGLPVLPLSAFALYLLGRGVRPLASAFTLMLTISGTIYMGGLFGMWTAFYRGLGLVDPAHLAGATATFQAMTTPQGAFLLTTCLSKLTIVGLGVQTLVFLGRQLVPVWSIVCVIVGCGLVLAFWDLDNWMLLGMVLLLIGFFPIRMRIIQPETQKS